jgi:hypothetical protein
MGSSMNMGFALLNSAVEKSSIAICNKLNDIYDTLKNPLYTGFSELYNRAIKNYNNGLYAEVLEDLQEAINKNKTDPRPHFLMGQTYLRGKNEDYNVIDLTKSIEALENAVKYIKPVALKDPDVRPMAADICFCLGLAYHAKANDSLHNSNELDYKKYLGEAKTSYDKSWDYSQNMLESLYNIARCKALFNETDEATKDLITVILKDHGYCIKTFLETDFNNELKDKLYSKLKRELFPKVKPVFDRIQSVKIDFKSPYSRELDQLIKTHLTDTFTEDTPPFDMLKASVYFPEILSVLIKEQAEYIEKLNRQERERKEQERNKIENERRRKEEEQKNEQQRKEQERRNEIARKEHQAKVIKWRIARSIPLVLAVFSILIIGIPLFHIMKEYGDDGKGAMALLFLLGIIVILLIQCFARIEGLWPIIVIGIFSYFVWFGSGPMGHEISNSIMSCGILIIASIICKIINGKIPYDL